MQIYADVMNREMEISRSTQTGALGSAIAGAVVAGADAGGYDGFDGAVDAMTGVLETTYTPIPANAAIYESLFGLYKRLHDVFGTKDYAENQFTVMKELIRIRDEVRNA
jgi:L-ribulokinase